MTYHNKIQAELWEDRSFILRFLHVFGSVAYIYVPDQLRKKLDQKQKKYLFRYGPN